MSHKSLISIATVTGSSLGVAKATASVSCGAAPIDGTGHHFDISQIPATRFNQSVAYPTSPRSTIRYAVDVDLCEPVVAEHTGKCKAPAFILLQNPTGSVGTPVNYCEQSFSSMVSGWTYHAETQAAEAMIKAPRGDTYYTKVTISCGPTVELQPVGKEFSSEFTDGKHIMHADFTSSVMCKPCEGTPSTPAEGLKCAFKKQIANGELNWAGDNACNRTWEQVKCYKGHAKRVMLDRVPANALKPNGFEYTGEVDMAKLTAVENLKYLWLHGNAFTGKADLTKLPETVKLIRLNNNRFSGRVNIRELPKRATHLFLQNNQFTGELVAADFEHFPDGMTHVHLENNNFYGSMPAFGTISPSVRVISVADNLMRGDVDLSNFKGENIRIISMHGNKIDGEVTFPEKMPTKIWNVTMKPSINSSICFTAPFDFEAAKISTDVEEPVEIC